MFNLSKKLTDYNVLSMLQMRMSHNCNWPNHCGYLGVDFFIESGSPLVSLCGLSEGSLDGILQKTVIENFMCDHNHDEFSGWKTLFSNGTCMPRYVRMLLAFVSKK